MLRTIFFCIICFLSLSTMAQGTALPSARKRAVYGKNYYVAPSRYDYRGVAREITEGKKTKYDKAQALYMWICSHIRYDHSNTLRTADECWDNGKAVCQGICELYYRMGRSIGLKPKLVMGMAKNIRSGEMERHAWLTVKTEKGLIMLDPTWGAALSFHNEWTHLPDPLNWFDVDMEEFSKTHSPS